ncbi:hypothetical protein PBY51_023945 [Eleginops maclovinus]|uniref:Uncharacterized protein n=1 Tax=Eleginops maclovinus TaxID=56733 RepID=A0AAN7X1F8_ELEMC|nr:hypothetical protein PBY51_023945 [Eleginops maclovinus]
MTWPAHHAFKKRSPEAAVSITSLLPLLRDPAHSVATIRHAMDKVKETVSFLNPGHIPVMTADQPIYTLAKQIQWHWPEQYGEDKFVIMFRGLHIEMAALKSIGTLLQESGWTGALVEAGVASSGTAESFLSAASITETRQAHQITACSLYQLLKVTTLRKCYALMLGVIVASFKLRSFSSGVWCCPWNWRSYYLSEHSGKPTVSGMAQVTGKRRKRSALGKNNSVYWVRIVHTTGSSAVLSERGRPGRGVSSSQDTAYCKTDQNQVTNMPYIKRLIT